MRSSLVTMLAFLLVLAAGVAVSGDQAGMEAAQCSLQSSRFWADTGPAAPAAPGGVGRVWDQNNILWTIASDQGGMSAAARAQAVAETRLVPWTLRQKTCGVHQIHVGQYQGNWVIYRSNMTPALPSADNVIVTVDPATAAYHGDSPARLARYWWYRLVSFLRGEVPAGQLPPALEARAGSEAGAWESRLDMGNAACGHMSGCGCKRMGSVEGSSGCGCGMMDSGAGGSGCGCGMMGSGAGKPGCGSCGVPAAAEPATP